MSLEKVDGEPVVGSPWEEPLIELGFRAGPAQADAERMTPSRLIRAAALTVALGVPVTIAPAASPTPMLKLLPATAVGLCANPATRTVTLAATVTPVRSGRASTGEAWFAFGSTATYRHGSAHVRVPWVSTTARPRSVTATITPAAGTTHYALLAKGPHGATTRTRDTILRAFPPPCPFPGGRRVSIPWILVGIDNDHLTATIRHDVPCGSSRTRVRVSEHADSIVSIGVSIVVPEPAPECFAEPPPVTATVKLPHAVAKAQLHHDALTPR